MRKMLKPKTMAQMLVAIVFACLYAIHISSKLSEISLLESEAVLIRQEIANESDIQNQLLKDIESSKSDAFVEEVARKNLGLVKYDEIIFVIED